MSSINSPILTNPIQTWNSRYDRDDYIFGTEPNHYLLKYKAYFKAGMSALAVADGEGRNSVWLAKQGLITTAFDISSVGVEKARKLARAENVAVNFSVADCQSWDWGAQKFDIIAAIFIQFADPVMRKKLFSQMIGALNPGGIIILQGYTPKQLEYKTGGPGLIDHLYTEDLLRKEFSDLEFINLSVYDAELKEGSQHAGMSALIGMVAKKQC